MPEVNNKHFSYDKAGYKAAAKARKRLGQRRNYSSAAIKMAKGMV